MSNAILQAAGEAFANIAGTLAECVRADVETTPSPNHADHFEATLATECRRLRGIGQEGVAGALEAMRSPMARLIREGW